VSTASRLRLILGDDHQMVREGFRKILEQRPEWEVVAEVGDGAAAVEQVMTLCPDVAILDIAMPRLNGIDATRQIVRRMPATRVLLLSMHSDEVYVARALQAGAKAFILKDSVSTDLLKGVAAVAADRTYFSPEITTLILDDYVRRTSSAGSADAYESLTEREREIFQLVAEGRTSKQVGEVLSISPATVETHRARIQQKLDIHNTAELVLYAVRRGVIA